MPSRWIIKPQFEAGRDEVGKGGVVRDPAVHERVCAEVVAWLEKAGWTVAGVTPSPITGPEGNIEFLVAARAGKAGAFAEPPQNGTGGDYVTKQ